MPTQTVRFRVPVEFPVRIDPVGHAYARLIEHSGDLMDVAMHTDSPEQAAVLSVLAEAMRERFGVVKFLALQRLAAIQQRSEG